MEATPEYFSLLAKQLGRDRDVFQVLSRNPDDGLYDESHRKRESDDQEGDQEQGDLSE